MKRTARIVLAVCVAAIIAGCGKPLMSPNRPRTQFDRYDALRNQYAEQEYVDEFGRVRPNLRGRLLQPG